MDSRQVEPHGTRPERSVADTMSSTPAMSAVSVQVVCLLILALYAVGSALYWLQAVLEPLLIAGVLVFVVRRIGQELSRWSMPRWLAHTLLVFLALLILWMFGKVLYLNTQTLILRIPQYQARLELLVKSAQTWLPGTKAEPSVAAPPPGLASPEKAAPAKKTPPTDKAAPAAVAPTTPSSPDPAKEGASEAAAPDDAEAEADLVAPPPPPAGTDFSEETPIDVVPVIAQLSNALLGDLFKATMHLTELSVMVLFYLIFMLVDLRRLPARIRRAFAPAIADQVLQVGLDIDDSIQRYLSFKTLVSAGLALSTAALGYLFGLEFWIFWGIVMFLANFITYLGSMVVCVPIMTLAPLQFTNPWAAVGFCVALILVRLVWIDYVEIRYSGEHLNLSPVLVLAALGFLGAFWGVVGMVLAVPFVTSVKIVLEHIPATRFLSVLMSEQ